MSVTQNKQKGILPEVLESPYFSVRGSTGAKLPAQKRDWQAYSVRSLQYLYLQYLLIYIGDLVWNSE